MSHRPCTDPRHPAGHATFRFRCSRCDQWVCDICNAEESDLRRCVACAAVIRAKREGSPNLAALRAEQRPGRCALCDEPLPEGCRVQCGDPECDRAYQRACNADHAHRKQLSLLGGI